MCKDSKKLNESMKVDFLICKITLRKQIVVFEKGELSALSGFCTLSPTCKSGLNFRSTRCGIGFLTCGG
jgi:hypothetical protein